MGQPSKYTEEFRREAVELFLSGDRPRSKVAESLGIHSGSLTAWVKETQNDSPGVQHFTPVVIDAARPCRHGVDTNQYGNNRIECDLGRLTARLRPMRSLRTDRTATVVIRGHAFVQICGAVTTNSVSRRATSVYVWRQLSMNSPRRSDRRTRPHGCAAPSIAQRNSACCVTVRVRSEAPGAGTRGWSVRSPSPLGPRRPARTL